MTLDGTNIEKLTDNVASEGSAQTVDGGTDIWVMTQDGADQRCLTCGHRRSPAVRFGGRLSRHSVVWSSLHRKRPRSLPGQRGRRYRFRTGVD